MMALEGGDPPLMRAEVFVLKTIQLLGVGHAGEIHHYLRTQSRWPLRFRHVERCLFTLNRRRYVKRLDDCLFRADAREWQYIKTAAGRAALERYKRNEVLTAQYLNRPKP